MMIQSWSLLAVAGITFLLLAPALVWCAISLVKGNRGDTLASAAFAPLQEVNLPSAGKIVVLVEVPRLVSDFANFQIELTEKQSGRSAVMKYTCVNAQGAVHGFDADKVPYGRLTAPRAGVYVVRMTGLDPGKDYSIVAAAFVPAVLGTHGASNHRDRILRRRHAAVRDLGRLADGADEAKLPSGHRSSGSHDRFGNLKAPATNPAKVALVRVE